MSESSNYICKECGYVFGDDGDNPIKCPGCWSVNIRPVPETIHQERDRLRAELAAKDAEIERLNARISELRDMLEAKQ